MRVEGGHIAAHTAVVRSCRWTTDPLTEYGGTQETTVVAGMQPSNSMRTEGQPM